MAGRKLSNADARTLFLNSAIRKCQFVNPSQAPSLGGTMTFVLPKAGICRGLLVTFSVPITIATNVQTPTPKAPWNFITNVHLQDYSGIDRVNASGYMLGQLSLLTKRMWDPSSSYPFTMAGPSGVDPYAAGAAYPFGLTAPYSSKAAEGGGANTFETAQRWKIPTAVASDNLVYSMWIPVAFGMNDPRGALLLNVPNGQVTLQLTVNNALFAASGVDTPYTSAGTVTLNNPSTSNINVYCYYWDPIAVPGVPTDEYPGGIPIPYEDLQLVHEVRSLVDSSGIAASTEKQYTFQSGRDYYRVIASIVENGTFNTNHITRTRWIYDGNTPTLDELTAGHLARAQYELGRELPEGTLYYDFADRPWDANSYGALAWGITTASSFVSTAPTYVEYLTDALYLATMANA